MNQIISDSYLRESDVLGITKLSKSTRWRLEKAGLFPKRRRLSAKAVGWLESEVKQWIQSRSVI
jgi:prophage regulatory protein